jgi:hypothetical protein
MVQHLHRWIGQGAGTPLPDSEYAAAVTRESGLFDQLREAGVLSVLPGLSDRRVGSLKRTPFGVLPTSLMEALGMAEELYEYAITQLAPYCLSCACPAIPPGALDQITVPGEGFLSLSVVDDEAAVSLRERCEWLGSERALVNKRLVRVESIDDAEGEPVISVISLGTASEGSRGSLVQLRNEASRWFARGGGPVRLMHFASREAQGEERGVVSGHWSCPHCKATFTTPTREMLDDAAPCRTCKGEGWLSDDESRLIACRDCDGFGSSATISRYELHGIALRQVAALTFEELAKESTRLPASLRERIQKIMQCCFGRYPLGTPIGLLSQGERVMLAMLCGELSGFEGVRYLADAAIVDRRASVFMQDAGLTMAVIARPEALKASGRLMPQREEGDVVLRTIRQGCLDLLEVRFPLGGLSVVSGPTGSGKSLLLSVISARFAKRRKLAHQNSFGSLKRCTSVAAEGGENQTVLEALGLAQELAAEIARTRRAQELGVLKEDLVLPNSGYRCRACVRGVQAGERCSECFGALYDWRVSGLAVGGATVAELLTSPIECLGDVAWVSEYLEYVMRVFPVELLGKVTLGSAVAELSRPEQRLLSIWGGLARVLSYAGARRRGQEGAPLAKELVLVDGSQVMPVRHAQLLEKMLFEINEMGATIVYADIPEGLEFTSTSVLQLEPQERQHQQRVRATHLDTRYARLCSAVNVSGK